MRDIAWTDEARRDYLEAIRYLAQRNPSAARRLRTLIDDAVQELAKTPTGRRGRVSGTYEKVLQGYPYIIPYALDDDAANARLVVLGIIHTSRNWTSDHWPGANSDS